MSWTTESAKYTSEPMVYVEIDWTSGTKQYAVDFIRPTAAAAFKANILSLSRIYQSIGDIKRCFELSSITIEFSDTDYEFRTKIEAEGIKNREIRIIIIHKNFSMAANSLTVFTGWICEWEPLAGLRFRILAEQKFRNIDNEYPDRRVELTDYPYADGGSVGWVIPIPYGTISALDLSGDGAYGHPSLDLIGGLPLVDTRIDQAITLIGRQATAITVNRVYIDKALQATPANYTIGTQVIDGQTHTEIRWAAGTNPTAENRVSADISYGARTPVEAMRHFMETFCEYMAGDFNAVSYAVALAKEISRGYTFDGVLWESKKTLRSILAEWREEYELDIYWNNDGEICFNYLSAILPPSISTYRDDLHVLSTFELKPRVTEILNKLKYGYNFNYSQAYYYNYATYQDVASQTKWEGVFEQFFGFRWCRSSAMARDLAARKIIRFKDPVTFAKLPFPLPSFEDNLCGVIKLTHFEGTGAAGYVDKFFQIRAKDYNLDNFVNEMLLEDSSNFIGNAFILGDEMLPELWINATSGQRDYGYLCGAADIFSDGLPGKQLLD